MNEDLTFELYRQMSPRSDERPCYFDVGKIVVHRFFVVSHVVLVDQLVYRQLSEWWEVE